MKITKLQNCKITRFNCQLPTAYCLLAFIMLLCPILIGQSTNTISNDGTVSPVWYIGDEDSGAVAIGISQGTAPSNHLTLGDELKAGSQTFTSGWQAGSGWKLDWSDTAGYALELDNLMIRGTLSAQELLIDQIRATNGNLLVSSAAKIWYAFPSINVFAVEDVTGHGVVPFAVGDLIMCQVVNASGVTYDGNGDAVNNTYLVKRIIYKVDQILGLFVYCSTLTGAPANKGTITRGDTFVRFGSLTDANRKGAIGLYADMPYSPYLRITDGVDSWADWKSQATVKAQLGNLTGITDAEFGGQLEGYGLYSNNAYIKGKVIITNPEDLEIEMPWDDVTNKPAYFNAPSGAGLFLSATNMGYYNTTNYPADPWRTYMDNTGKFYLKGSSDEYLSWDGTSLTIEGDILIKNPTQVKTDLDIQASEITNDEGWITISDVPDPGIQTYYQASAPTGTIREGSIWIESDQLNSIYRYESSTWVEKIGIGTGVGTYISSNGIYTGVIAADQVVAGTLTGFTIETAAGTGGETAKLTSGKMAYIYQSVERASIRFDITAGIFIDFLSETYNDIYVDGRVRADNLYISGNQPVASQSWVTSQGYITDGNTGWDNSYGFITSSSLTWSNITGKPTGPYVVGISLDGQGHVIEVEYGGF